MREKFNSFKAAAQRGYLKAGVVVGTALVAVPAFAQGEPEDPFAAALAAATAKVGEYSAALVGLGAVAVVFMIALKYVKKIPRAA